MRRAGAALLGLLATLAGAGERSSDPASAALLGLGYRTVAAEELPAEVARLGGVPFRSEVELRYLDRSGLRSFLGQLLDEEYPRSRADADRRMLTAFDLLPPRFDLRSARRELLERSVVGFYDERPAQRRLYVVSERRELTPVNQVVLAHELRHALQDQYAAVHERLPEDLSDFDDRRLAYLCLLEGDASVLTELFLAEQIGRSVPGLSEPGDVEGVPDVLRAQLLQPYLVGRGLVRTLRGRGGWDAVREAWSAPPASTEQVLHPDKLQEPPRPVGVAWSPGKGTPIADGVLGELLLRALLGAGGERAAAGWGGDRYRAWDVRGRTLLLWRSEWDSAAEAAEFRAAVLARFQQRHGAAVELGPARVFAAGPWRFAWSGQGDAVTLVASDDRKLLAEALASVEVPRPTP